MAIRKAGLSGSRQLRAPQEPVPQRRRPGFNEWRCLGRDRGQDDFRLTVAVKIGNNGNRACAILAGRYKRVAFQPKRRADRIAAHNQLIAPRAMQINGKQLRENARALHTRQPGKDRLGRRNRLMPRLFEQFSIRTGFQRKRRRRRA